MKSRAAVPAPVRIEWHRVVNVHHYQRSAWVADRHWRGSVWLGDAPGQLIDTTGRIEVAKRRQKAIHHAQGRFIIDVQAGRITVIEAVAFALEADQFALVTCLFHLFSEIFYLLIRDGLVFGAVEDERWRRFLLDGRGGGEFFHFGAQLAPSRSLFAALSIR